MPRFVLMLKLGNLFSLSALMSLSFYLIVWDKEVVDEWFRHPNYFMPASFTNMIIPFAFFFFILFILAQFRPEFDKLVDNGIDIWFTLSNLFAISWLVCLKFRWFYFFEISMFGILISGSKLHQNLGFYRFQDWLSYSTVYLPFTMLSAWSAVNIVVTTFVVFFDLNHGEYEYSKQLSTGAMLIFTLLGLYQSEHKGHIVYGLVIGWSLFGIAIEQSSTPHLNILGLICCGVVLSSVGRIYFHRIITHLGIGSVEEHQRLL
ncbi:hypothetical protein K7432_014636 [Basidiobolus ranarum]|uniref:Peptidase S54 rhomboid domain-containing protein n=1 Tax=Basidiobolus ranarum TaxID=34480 RepID=A0ABR2VPA2_9FUNG